MPPGRSHERAQVQNVVKVNCISNDPPGTAAEAEARAKRVVELSERLASFEERHAQVP